MEERLIFSEIHGVESLCAVFGLTFPEQGITEFQKAFLLLAHLCASLRDHVLCGREIPSSLIQIFDDLAKIVCDNRELQTFHTLINETEKETSEESQVLSH